MTDLAARPDQATAVDLPRPGEWSISWRGHHFHESGVTGQHLAVLSLITGTDDYEALDIDPRHGHQRLMMMIAAMEAVEACRSLGDNAPEDAIADAVALAVESVSKATADEILGSLIFG